MTELYRSKSWLYSQYIVKENSTGIMAKLAKVNSSTIRTWLKECKIKLRTTSEAMKLFNQKNPGYWGGKNHPNWKGGRYKASDGYILIYKPEHPNANRQGYIFEHRLLLEKQLDRYLNLRERVHHINRKKDDNRIENFMLFPSMFSHRNYHKKLKEITTA